MPTVVSLSSFESHAVQQALRRLVRSHSSGCAARKARRTQRAVLQLSARSSGVGALSGRVSLQHGSTCVQTAHNHRNQLIGRCGTTAEVTCMFFLGRMRRALLLQSQHKTSGFTLRPQALSNFPHSACCFLGSGLSNLHHVKHDASLHQSQNTDLSTM